MQAIGKAFIVAYPMHAGKLCVRTAVNIMNRFCEDNNMQFLRIKNDHNCCPWCKEFQLKELGYYSSRKWLEKEKRTEEAASYQALEDAVVREHAKHLSDDIHMRSTIAGLRDLFVRLDQDLLKKGVDLSQNWPFASLMRGTIIHIDDKTAWNLPRLQMCCAATLFKQHVDMNGCADIMEDRINNYFGQVGTTTKDGDAVACALLLIILERLNGHKVVVVLFDNW